MRDHITDITDGRSCMFWIIAAALEYAETGRGAVERMVDAKRLPDSFYLNYQTARIETWDKWDECFANGRWFTALQIADDFRQRADKYFAWWIAKLEGTEAKAA